MNPPDAHDYLAVLRLYHRQLDEPFEPGGTRFELLFRQVVRLLVAPSPFNRTLPGMYTDAARRFETGHAPTRAHFADDENRQYFLSDLYDFVYLEEEPSQREA